MEGMFMTDKNNGVRLGDGVKDKVIDNINENVSDVFDLLLNSFFSYVKDKIPSAVQSIEKIFSNPEMKKDITTLWSKQLFEKGIIPKGYNGLPEELLIANLHQDGYLEGLFSGYVLSMMALVDNGAENELILSVRASVRPDLIGHHYDDREELYKKYNEETYNWIESSTRIGDEEV